MLIEFQILLACICIIFGILTFVKLIGICICETFLPKINFWIVLIIFVITLSICIGIIERNP